MNVYEIKIVVVLKIEVPSVDLVCHMYVVLNSTCEMALATTYGMYCLSKGNLSQLKCNTEYLINGNDYITLFMPSMHFSFLVPAAARTWNIEIRP